DTVIYTFNIAPYNDGARKGSISFYANEGAPISYTFLQGIADVTVKEFIDANVDNAIQYRIVGHVTRFNKYNNNFYLKDYTGEVYAYYVDTQGIKDIAIGDFVTVVGKRSEYNGEPQLPKGTLLEKYTASPEVSVAEFLTKEDSKEVYYKLTGTITKIKDALYGNVYLQDANGDIVYVYGLLSGYGATESADKQGLVEEKGLKEGDTITIVGNKASHKGSPQVGNAVYMSHTSN
ncbi:MAG: DNA-binding protein, partial [Bacteroidaceae bacterium]|nr:DNA-binding protein [Bacteroidaceae bacterium]